MAWSAAPHTPRLPPTRKASTTRGARRSRTITAAPASACHSPAHTSRRGSGTAPALSPRRRHTITAASQQRHACPRSPLDRLPGARPAPGWPRAPRARAVELRAAHPQEPVLPDRRNYLPLGPAGEGDGPSVVVKIRSGFRAATASTLTTPDEAVTSAKRFSPPARSTSSLQEAAAPDRHGRLFPHQQQDLGPVRLPAAGWQRRAQCRRPRQPNRRSADGPVSHPAFGPRRSTSAQRIGVDPECGTPSSRSRPATAAFWPEL